jgi:SAM-dependent methyltransferase
MQPPNSAQIEFWNGHVGQKWAALWAGIDVMLAPVSKALLDALGSIEGKRVLDIGCGAGATCELLAAQGADVTGLDVSYPMLAVARARLGSRVDFVEADAATWRSDKPFDMAVSRFGVMFFEDPEAAFSNIRTNICSGGQFAFACWRRIEENEWVEVPLAAVRHLLPVVEQPQPDAPGPFAFANDARVRNLLRNAGFCEIDIQPRSLSVCLAEAGGAPEATRLVMQIGPTSRALAEANEADRAAAEEALREALGRYDNAGRVELGGEIWLVTARAGS